MSIFVTLYAALLFFALTPAILLRFPSNGSKYLVAAVHSFVFAIIFYFTHRIVTSSLEGLTNAPTPTPNPKWNTDYHERRDGSDFYYGIDYNGNTVRQPVKDIHDQKSCNYAKDSAGNYTILRPEYGWNAQAPYNNFKDHGVCFGPSTSGGGSGGGDGCFSKRDTLTLENGSSISFSDAKLGDRILVVSEDGLSFSFSEIIALPHQDDEEVATFFYQLTTASGRTVRVTPNHLVALVKNDKTLLVAAKDILLGQTLQTVAGPEQIVSIDIIEENGVATAVTLAGGLIVVNGFVASPFSIDHVIADTFYELHRGLGNVIPNETMKAFSNSCYQFATALAF